MPAKYLTFHYDYSYAYDFCIKIIYRKKQFEVLFLQIDPGFEEQDNSEHRMFDSRSCIVSWLNFQSIEELDQKLKRILEHNSIVSCSNIQLKDIIRDCMSEPLLKKHFMPLMRSSIV